MKINDYYFEIGFLSSVLLCCGISFISTVDAFLFYAQSGYWNVLSVADIIGQEKFANWIGIQLILNEISFPVGLWFLGIILMFVFGWFMEIDRKCLGGFLICFFWGFIVIATPLPNWAWVLPSIGQVMLIILWFEEYT